MCGLVEVSRRDSCDERFINIVLRRMSILISR